MTKNTPFKAVGTYTFDRDDLTAFRLYLDGALFIEVAADGAFATADNATEVTLISEKGLPPGTYEFVLASVYADGEELKGDPVSTKVTGQRGAPINLHFSVI